MNARRHTTLALIERVARVREVQAQQRLADALAKEKEQFELVGTVSDQLSVTDRMFEELHEHPALDLARAELYRQIAWSIKCRWVKENEILHSRIKARAARSNELVHKTRYRDCVIDRAEEAARACRSACEQQSAGEQLETWVFRNARNSHG